MNIASIKNNGLADIPATPIDFGWPGALLTVTGSGFGPNGVNHVGLLMGSTAIALKTVSWTDTKITVQVPAGVPSRTYHVGIFSKPVAATVVTGAAVRAAATGHVSAHVTIPEPLHPNLHINIGHLSTQPLPAPPLPVPLSNLVSYFFTLGPVVPIKNGPFADYYAQVGGYRDKYGFDQDWEYYMYAYPTYYGDAHHAYHALDTDPIQINYMYESGAPNLLKKFDDEAAHMKQLKDLLTLCFPGDAYNFNVVFGPPAAGETPFVQVISASSLPGGLESPDLNNIRISNDGTLVHEMGHRLGVYHHYNDQNSPYVPINEGEKCVMNRNAGGFCSACSMGMNLDWDKVNDAANKKAAEQLTTDLGAHFKPYSG